MRKSNQHDQENNNKCRRDDPIINNKRKTHEGSKIAIYIYEFTYLWLRNILS